MRRLLAWTACLLITALVLGDEKKPAVGANRLSADEIQQGWLLLFDGESTFGWKIDGDAQVKDGVLVLGGSKETRAEPTTHFGECGLSFEADWSGTRAPQFKMGPTTLTLIEATKGTFATQRMHSSSFPAQPRPPMQITVPAGTTLSLRAVKLYPMGRSGFFARASGKSEQGMESLFTGKDLKGWKQFEGKGKKSKYTVTSEGWLNVKDGPGDLQTVKQFDDFVLQLECISNGKHLNSGIFFRCRPGEYQQGYEAQIRNEFTAKPTQKYTIDEYNPRTHKLLGKKTIESPAVDYGTGAIYRRMPARRGVARDGEWFTLTVVARGRHIATWVNGIQVVDWTDNRPADDNARQGFRAAAGAISIQGHDPTTDLSFRNLRITALPRSRKR